MFSKFVKKLSSISSSSSKLGGNLGRTNIDLPLLDYFIKEKGILSFLDIGCGKGGMVFHAIAHGLHARGIEGDVDSIPTDCPLIQNIDYRDGYYDSDKSFDLGWSIECLEHIPESCLINVMQDFRKCRYVVMTAAPPGWGGYGHVNEQPEAYWINLFQENDFDFSSDETMLIREVSSITFGGVIRHDKKQFIRNRGLFFRNRLLR